MTLQSRITCSSVTARISSGDDQSRPRSTEDHLMDYTKYLRESAQPADSPGDGIPRTTSTGAAADRVRKRMDDDSLPGTAGVGFSET